MFPRLGWLGRGALLTLYDERFFEELREGARRSARVIVPLIVDRVRPRSVVDVGCGLGTWLAVFLENGIADVVGVDGDYVDRARLEIPPESFLPRDLSRALHLDRTFDLAVSLEVAEHLPAECAATFVDSLTTLSPFVVFSAAIPFQGGTNHVNEQWPDYWAALFEERGFAPVDCIRREVWSNEAVEWWYAQNILLFVDERRLAVPPDAGMPFQRTPRGELALVHPRQYLWQVDSAREASQRAGVAETGLTSQTDPSKSE
jgi:SAM-dependent methyltransferase